MTELIREQQLKVLEDYCDAQRNQDALDDLVHDLKSEEAAAINNGGVSAQLEYLLENLGALEAARAVMGGAAVLPKCFGGGEAVDAEQTWRVTYRVCAVGDGAELHLGTIIVKATTSETEEKAIRWAHENVPYCDARTDCCVTIVHVEPAEESADDGTSVATESSLRADRRSSGR